MAGVGDQLYDLVFPEQLVRVWRPRSVSLRVPRKWWAGETSPKAFWEKKKLITRQNKRK